jgi:hypothetical protein
MTTNWHDLIQRYISGTITEAETQALEQQLKTDAALRDWYLDALNLDSALEAAAESAQTALSLPVPFSQRALTPVVATSTRWQGWRPLTAAAAGLVIGLFSASMVFGFGARSVEKVISLLQESFESGPAPLVTGIPQEVNLWSGDYSEIVETYEGVKPRDGTKMARVLRSDFEGKTASKPSKQGDLMRVIDVRPFLREANGGEVVITLSALFNAAHFPEAERYDGAVYLYALGQLDSTEESLLEDALAHSHGGCRSLDRDPATWQRASARLLLPPGTERVLLKVSFTPVPASGKNLSPLPDHVTFAGHFVDDVRASINIRQSVSNHGSEALP